MPKGKDKEKTPERKKAQHTLKEKRRIKKAKHKHEHEHPVS